MNAHVRSVMSICKNVERIKLLKLTLKDSGIFGFWESIDGKDAYLVISSEYLKKKHLFDYSVLEILLLKYQR